MDELLNDLKEAGLMPIDYRSRKDILAGIEESRGVENDYMIYSGTRPGRSPDRWAYGALHALPPFQWYFCDQIWALVWLWDNPLR